MSLQAGVLPMILSGSLQNPAFSPDGNSIVYTRFRGGYNKGISDLYILDLETGANTVLIADGSANVSEPGSTWSKNSEIIFSSDRDGPDQAIAIKSDSSGRRALTAIAPAMAWEPSWAPDGVSFVYERHDIEARGRIALVQNGQEQLITAEADDCRQPCWSPHGDLIVYQRRTESSWNLWLHDVAANQAHQFTHGNEDTDATFSPDGAAVLYSNGQLVLVPINGGTVQKFGNAPYMGAPSISPDGKLIACETSTGDPDGGHGTQLMVVPISPESVPATTAPAMTSTSSFPYGPTIKNVMLARGYPWFPDQNVVTIETMNPDGSLCTTGANTFDDIKMVLDGAGTVIGGPWDATDHPGYYWTQHPMASGGAFIIALGPQACWTPGPYNGVEVWRQAPDSTIMGHRDPNDTYKRQGPPIAHPDIGVHHHHGYNLPKNNISNAAAGCQVIRLNSEQEEFMQLTKQCPRYLADPTGYRLTATVLEARDILAVPEQIVPAPTPTQIVVPAPVLVPTVQTGGLVLDTAENVTSVLSELKAAGYTTIIRYLTTNTNASKLVKPAEAHAIAAAGLRLGLVFEVWGGVNNFSHGDINSSSGAAHAFAAKTLALQVGAPQGACLYFAIDTDTTAGEIQSYVLPYFRAIKTAIGGLYRVGIYSGGAACAAVLDAGYADLAWLAAPTKWNGSAAFAVTGRAVLTQKLPATIAGLDADPNVPKPGADIGDFVPFVAVPTPTPTPLPTPPPPPIPSPIPAPPPVSPPAPPPLFSQDGLATWYSDNTNASGSPVNNTTDMTAAHNTLPFGTAVKVTRTDTQASCVVTIQDRGGAGLSGSRIIDLRPAPATVLDMIIAGVVPVHVETVSVTPPPPIPVPTPVVVPPIPVPPVPPVPPVVVPPVINLPTTSQEAVIASALAQILTVVQSNPDLQAAIKTVLSGTLKGGTSTGGALLSMAGSLFGVWAIPLAVGGYIVLSLLQANGVVTEPTTVATATGAAALVGVTGIAAWLQKAANMFAQITTSIGKGNQP